MFGFAGLRGVFVYLFPHFILSKYCPPTCTLGIFTAC